MPPIVGEMVVVGRSPAWPTEDEIDQLWPSESLAVGLMRPAGCMAVRGAGVAARAVPCRAVSAVQCKCKRVNRATETAELFHRCNCSTAKVSCSRLC